MRVKKKFQEIGGTSMVIIPKAWITSQENESGKKMVGVHIDINGKLELIPMWEEEI